MRFKDTEIGYLLGLGFRMILIQQTISFIPYTSFEKFRFKDTTEFSLENLEKAWSDENKNSSLDKNILIDI